MLLFDSLLQSHDILSVMVRKSDVFFTFLKGLALDPLQSGMYRGGLSAAHQDNHRIGEYEDCLVIFAFTNQVARKLNRTDNTKLDQL